MDRIPEQVGDWLRKKTLGKGSFGEVTFWENQITLEKIAIKRIFIDDNNPKTKKRWENEIDMLMNRVNNENIVKAKKIDTKIFMEAFKNETITQLPILIMEYCDGGDLRHQLFLTENCCGLNEIDVLNILKSLKNSISYLHKLGITHRDIKPENIVIQKNGNKKIYKLTDLGYAKDIIQTVQASHVGTIGYFAPELVLDQTYSRTVDYWSMGIVIFEIICGMRPFLPHLRVAGNFKKILNKTDEHIAITENLKNEYVYHNGLFYQNHINQILKNYLDNWLKLSLKIDSKTRGLYDTTVINKETNTTEDHCKNKLKSNIEDVKNLTTAGEITVMNENKLSPKIFTDIDKILSLNIMTVFSLSTYEFLYYEITNDMTMKELTDRIMHDIIPQNDDQLKNNFYMILPIEQNITEITKETKPIDLVLKYNDNDDNNDLITTKYTPMLYVTEINKKNFKLSSPNEAIKMISDYLCTKRTDFKLYNIIEFCRHTLYLIEYEEILYTTYMNGYYNYVIYLNDFIVKFRPEIHELVKGIDEINAIMNYINHILNLNKNIMDKKNMTNKFKDEILEWQKENNKMSQEINTLLNVSQKISKRYESVLRRSNELIQNELLQNFHQTYSGFKRSKRDHKSYFPIDEIHSIYESLKQPNSIGRDNDYFKQYLKKLYEQICNIIYKKVFGKRIELHKDYNLEELKNDLTAINEEFQKIQIISKDTRQLLNNYKIRLNNSHEKQLIEFYKMIESNAIDVYKMNQNDEEKKNIKKEQNDQNDQNENISNVSSQNNQSKSLINREHADNYESGAMALNPASIALNDQQQQNQNLKNVNRLCYDSDTESLIENNHKIRQMLDELIQNIPLRPRKKNRKNIIELNIN